MSVYPGSRETSSPRGEQDTEALTITDVSKRFEAVQALDAASMVVRVGTLTALLGPSGCGKTTLLRIIAGFEAPDSGTVHIGERLAASIDRFDPPETRSVGIVPQEGSLFPHLSVQDNVGFGLPPNQRRGSRTSAMLELVGLSGYEKRRPHELSGGQQQRVALARCLAPRPSIVLLDEPFAALDATLRAELRSETRQLLRETNTTAVLVTHDQDEALSMSDTVVLMRAGQVVQSAEPAELYANPVDTWAAQFVGDANLLPVVSASMRSDRVATAAGTIAVRGDTRSGGGPATALLRPEQLLLEDNETARTVFPSSQPGDATFAVQAVITRVVFHGHEHLVSLRTDEGLEMVARTPAHQRFRITQRVGVRVTGAALLMPPTHQPHLPD